MPALSDRLLADIFIENLFFLIKSESGFYLYYYLLSVLSNGLQSSDRETTKKFKNIFPPQILLSICLTLSMMIRTCWSKDRTKLCVQLVSNLNNENDDVDVWRQKKEKNRIFWREKRAKLAMLTKG